MARTPIPIGNGFYQDESLIVSAQNCVNWYPDVPQVPSLSEVILRGSPGTKQLATSGTLEQVNRGAWTLKEIPYFVNGDALYRLNLVLVDDVEVFDMENLGAITGAGRVSMAENGTQLMILVPGGSGFIFTTTPDTLVTIGAAGFTASGAPQHVVFVDALFVCSTDEKKLIRSSPNDGTLWNALHFTSAESDPDGIAAPLVFRNQLVALGVKTGEFFQNTGSADRTFQRTGLFLDKGTRAPFSIVVANDTFMFVGAGNKESPAIWEFRDNRMVKISTTAIDSLLQNLTALEVSQIFGYSFAQRGAYFVEFTLPKTTLVLNTVNNRWSERASRIVTAEGTPITTRSRVNSVVAAYGRLIVADSQDGRVGTLDPKTFNEYGNAIAREITTQPFQNNGMSFRLPMIELTTVAGGGNAAEPDPTIRMSRSLDGGHTFTQPRSRSTGMVGDYGRRTIWRRNGRAKRMELFRWQSSAATEQTIVQAFAEIMGGRI